MLSHSSWVMYTSTYMRAWRRCIHNPWCTTCTPKPLNAEFSGLVVLFHFQGSYGSTNRESSSGEGGIWTLAPRLTTYSLSRGAPSASLGTSPRSKHVQYDVLIGLAERMGFEPMCPWRQTVFKTASLWPLRYLSITKKSNWRNLLFGQRNKYSSKPINACQLLFSFFLQYFFNIFLHLYTVANISN